MTQPGHPPPTATAPPLRTKSQDGDCPLPDDRIQGRPSAETLAPELISETTVSIAIARDIGAARTSPDKGTQITRAVALHQKASVKRTTKETDVRSGRSRRHRCVVDRGRHRLPIACWTCWRHFAHRSHVKAKATCIASITLPKMSASRLCHATKQALGDMKASLVCRCPPADGRGATRVAVIPAGRFWFQVNSCAPRSVLSTPLVQEWFRLCHEPGRDAARLNLYGSNDHLIADPASRVWRGRAGCGGIDPPPNGCPRPRHARQLIVASLALRKGGKKRNRLCPSTPCTSPLTGRRRSSTWNNLHSCATVSRGGPSCSRRCGCCGTG